MADEPKVVNADPTKTFFISMLVRDISLVPAIVDLVDNSVDGARRLRPRPAPTEASETASDSPRFEGLWINVRTTEAGFEISDNCGGIPWEIARDYAFRFGRPDDAPASPNSIGQFGIGMKRALFKLGSAFSVDSSTTGESFLLKVNVNEWAKTKKWVFPDVTYEAKETSLDACGTVIKVKPLHPSVSDTFTETRFRNNLTLELARAHQATINDGLAITLNNVPINVNVQTLLSTDQLKPARISETLDADTDRPVHVEIVAGIDVSSPADAGWYIYCNGRLILGPDRSEVTGWGEGKGKTLPQYHNQFARFKGYVFFESADVEKLPWTTTKEGIDQDHRVFRAVRPRMLEVARPIIDFLNALDSEKDRPPRDVISLETVVASAEKSGAVPITSVGSSDKFVSPPRTPAPKKPQTQSIQFSRPIAQINAVKKKLKVSSAREVGEKTFDYYFRRECDDSDE
ncbi:ATP-binding protein [Nocardioides marinus]